MANPGRISRLPTCLSCLQRFTQPFPSTLSPLSFTQTRGVKTTSKTEEEDLKGIPVRLLTNMPTFGRKDAIIRVKRGKMRNAWFPKGQAEYMTRQRFKELGLTEAAIGVRDRSFGSKVVLEEEDDKNEAPVELPKAQRKKEVLTLPPEETISLLKTLLPATLTFARKPISTPAPAPAPEPAIPRSPSLAMNAATSTSTPTPDPSAAESGPVAIFGSVSTTDILAAIKERLHADSAQSDRIGLTAESIEILGLEAGEDRIKHLGTFEVLISASKELEPVRQTIEVVAEASE
ncbi:hypothetical protein F4779DRAFT_193479 [Xylariaceae sp. FL0662B]|nr:hypothetical protein F4779DRAFT_193479 [Xylariaceae sp. FL0662B]